MKIWTSYFANIRNLPEGIVPISICGKSPEGWKGLEYKILAPKKWFFMVYKKTHDKKFYIENFKKEVLDPLVPWKVIKDLYELSGGRDVALVCYEKPEDFCHRHLVAEWLSSTILEYTIKEA